MLNKTHAIQSENMTPRERHVAISLAGIFSSRMLGLFMILPVFTLYTHELKGSTLFLAGVAMGIYGLTQALFQIPLGMLSDRIGRKPVIIGGLLVFAAGSVLAALSTSIDGVIAGRALQGTGAIASAVIALAADLTREEHRVKVMALIGVSIGVSFAIAMVAGPVLHGWFGVPGIFWTTALLALGGILLVRFAVPNPTVSSFHRDTEIEVGWFLNALRDRQLLRVDAGIFILHLNLMASFIVIPRILEHGLGIPGAHHWHIYLPVMGVAMVAIVPFIIIAEKKHKIKQIMIGAIGTLILAEWGMSRLDGSLSGMVLMLLLFFTAFNLLEATLPSLIAKLAPAAHKGTAMGVYTTSQFLGVFAGGMSGGWISGHLSNEAVFMFNGSITLIWLLLAASMKSPRYFSSQLLNVGTITESAAQKLAQQLATIRGVEEAMIIAEDGVAYLKVDKANLDTDALYAFSRTEE
ncbi:Inner membrane transport protein YajR [hydrothermal vent metagenome]|uniref:Inner membrane transport protein YajR n=1 Tax=hydrothermal vent metagenome TaxID=652676 RepID=A0A3B1B8U0_9ZZZZ